MWPFRKKKSEELLQKLITIMEERQPLNKESSKELLKEDSKEKKSEIKIMNESLPSLQYCIAHGFVTPNPLRSTAHSAGIDIFVPEFTETFYRELIEKNSGFSGWSINPPTFNPAISSKGKDKKIIVNSLCRIILPSGLRFSIPHGTMLIAANRSGIASKYGLIYGAHVIDSDYQGIYYISLINTSSTPVTITPNTKIIQLLHLPILMYELKKVPEDLLYEKKSTRGEGGFGSTG